MSDPTMIINGERCASATTFGVINPATAEVFAQAPDCSRDQLDDAMQSASKAFTEWRRDEGARRAALRAGAGVLFGAVDQLAPLLTAEQGRPITVAPEEILAAGFWLQYFADLEAPSEVVQDDDNVFAEVIRRPMGVVAAITPWNFPLALACWKIAPALRAGNTMVLKPSPYTPLSTLRMVELLNTVLPPGVLNAVSGGDELGKWMSSHPVPRKISITGSIAAGKHVALSSAPDLKRVTLELGGNDAAILLDDVDVDAVADKLFWGAFTNSGQICAAVKRVYVPERLESWLVDALADRARDVKVGDGSDPATQLGPINNAPQYERVQDLVADALAGGATAAAGGKASDSAGYFFEPTILTGLSDGTRIVDEEQFGPALPVITYRDEEDALARANATSFGLTGSIWSADPARASKLAGQLEVGTAWVNTHLALGPNLPFGGLKSSGLGVENGIWGLDSFSEIQVQYVAKT